MNTITLTTRRPHLPLSGAGEHHAREIGDAVTTLVGDLERQAKKLDPAPIILWDRLEVSIEPRSVSHQQLTSVVEVADSHLSIRAEIDVVTL